MVNKLQHVQHSYSKLPQLKSTSIILTLSLRMLKIFKRVSNKIKLRKDKKAKKKSPKKVRKILNQRA